jgi:hypothetical protein
VTKNLYIDITNTVSPATGEATTETHKKTLIVFSIVVLFFTLSGLFSPVHASDPVIWQGSVPSSGAPVVGPVLTSGETYTIVASNRWWYSPPTENNLAADAEYYTTDYSDSWNWGNYFRVDDHSFLQINGQDVEWGPFSNGDTNHTYTINYIGQGTAITFAIVDWLGNNSDTYCHLDVTIIESTTCVGGYIVDPGSGSGFGYGALFAAVGICALAVPAVALVVKRRARAR